MPVERDFRARFPREMKPGGAARSNALEHAAERAFRLCCRMPATFATAECLEKVSRLFHAALTAMRNAWTVHAHEE